LENFEMIKNGLTSPFSLSNLRSRLVGSEPLRGSDGYNGYSADGLDQARARVAKAEVELSAARTAMRAAARKAGVSLANLFGDSSFIARSTGDRWASEARAAGAIEAAQKIGKALGVPPASDDEIAQSTAETQRRMAEMKSRWRALKAAGFVEALNGRDFALCAELYLEALGEDLPAKAKADAILQAGRRARMTRDNERPPPTGMAADIVRAGKRRRGEI
jgi:ribonuclease HI